jgi:hypothetical protein
MQTKESIMKEQTLIEEMSITELEQRVEFSCCGGGGGGGGGPGTGCPEGTVCDPE